MTGAGRRPSTGPGAGGDPRPGGLRRRPEARPGTGREALTDPAWQGVDRTRESTDPAWQGVDPTRESTGPTARRGADRRDGARGPAAAGAFKGPPPPGRTVLSRILVALSAVLSCLVFTVTIGGFALYEHFDRQINRLRLSLDGDRPADPDEGTTNFLLVGSDSRAGTGNEFQRGGEVAGQRSDTTILAHLDTDGTTTLVSFPRDTLVHIPGHGRDKLTQAISIGGPSLLIRTIESLTDIRVDHYVSVDLAGFREMTDAIGGVTVCVKALPDGSRANLRDEWSQWRGRVGENHLNGDQALAFVRQRHGLPDNDFDRIRRQQQFIGAVFRKATSEGVLTSPTRLENLLSAATRALTIDDGTDIDDLRLLAKRMGSLSSDQIRFMTIPVHAPTAAEGGNGVGELPRFGSVQLYDRAQLDAFLAPLRGRGDGEPAPAAGRPSTLPTSQVTVDVYNAARIGGLATTASRDLDELGFDVGSPADWPDGALAVSEVRYGPGQEAAARAVQAVVPDARLVSDDSLSDRVSLVLGASFEDVDVSGGVTQAVSGTPPAAPGPDPASGSPTSGVAAPPAAARPPSAVTATELTTGCTY